MRRDEKAEGLLSALLSDEIVFFEVATRIDKEVFVENEYNNFLIDLRNFYKQFRKKPTLDEFKAFTNTAPYPFMVEVFAPKPVMDRELIRNRFYANYQRQQLTQMMDRLADRIESSSLDVDDVLEDVKKTVQGTKKIDEAYVELGPDNIGAKYLEARDFRIKNTAPLAFKMISRILGGGIAPGELEIFIAASNRGKTLYLINELYAALMHDEKVLYLTMENRDPSITSRLSDRMLLMTKDLQRGQEPFVLKFLRKFYGLVKEPVIMYRAANSFSTDDLDIWLEEYQTKTGQRFDRIIVDYLNKMRRKKARDSWEEERRMTDDLRALAIAHDTRVITAAQTNRAGLSIGRENSPTDTIDETMLQGGFGQYETADIVLGYSETPLEKQRGVGRVIILKARESGGRGREFVVNVAPWIGLITDHADEILMEDKKYLLENPDIRFGQLPGLHPKEGRPKKKKEGGEPTVNTGEQGGDAPVEGNLGVTL